MRVQLPQIVLLGLLVAGVPAGPLAPALSGQSCSSAGSSPSSRPEALPPDTTARETSLAGRVRDGTHGVPVPGARVDLRWTSDDGDEVEREIWTDADGRFRTCDVPDGIEVVLSAEVGGGAGPEVEAISGSGEPVRLSVPLPHPGEPSGLLGRVREDESERAVARAEVRLPDLDRSTRTDRRGTFFFEDVEPGSYRLELEHLSYGSVTDTVHLVAGRPLQMRFSVAPSPIRIAGVEATARSRGWFRDRTELRRRMRRGFGDFITREDIVRRNEPPLHFLLNSVPGVRAESVSHPWGDTYYPVVRSCGVPQVFVDGARVVIEPATGIGIDDFLSSNIEAIEVYKGAAGAPTAYSDSRAGCGVILIWTREPG